MTVWARSDVCAVSISPDHGGCGISHSRPVVAGAPVRTWALTCQGGCEDYLRNDPLWSGTPETVPESPDEIAIRQDLEKRGQLESQASMATALNDLAKLGDLPGAIAQLAQMMAGNAPQQLAQQPLLLCRNGHRNTSTVKFCGECGADLDDAANKRPVGELSPTDPKKATSADESQEKSAKDLGNQELEGMSLAALRDIAANLGVPPARSKADQIASIRAASA